MARQLSEQLEREVSAEELLKEHTQLKPPAHSVAVSATPPPRRPTWPPCPQRMPTRLTVPPTPAPLPPDDPAAVSAAHAAPAADRPMSLRAARPASGGPGPCAVPDAARAPDG